MLKSSFYAELFKLVKKMGPTLLLANKWLAPLLCVFSSHYDRAPTAGNIKKNRNKVTERIKTKPRCQYVKILASISDFFTSALQQRRPRDCPTFPNEPKDECQPACERSVALLSNAS